MLFMVLSIIMEDLPFDKLKEEINTRVIGRNIFYYSSLPSTMDTAREKARQGALEGTIIIADEQTAGRGRLKRQWLAPKGNIALSIILRPQNASLPYLIMIASLTASRSIESVSGYKTQIKWPNDILIDGKKICGILIENEFKGNHVHFCIIGIGINVTLKVSSHKEIAETAVSLAAKQINDLRLKLIKALLVEFDKLYLQLPDHDKIYKTWCKKLVTLGKKVKATSGKQIIEGTAEDVDESGALLIRDIHGDLVKVVAGDVTLRE
jgi:BirA family transcriptional regulator, biotin operon repressor / biotin---[acetyl-CoA-carboxylase] ligase